ncbi:MAG: hypothetical protein GX442_16740 [Candidatus Riflebacteria bacterium]|nr:hypothetical protein [Candidatus Riflebacteria bacterium]
MTFRFRCSSLVLLLLLALVTAAPAPGKSLTRALAPADDDDPYTQVVRKVENMVSDGAVQALARKYGLDVINVTWEDTGRFEGSSVGPNISDMTIQVLHGAKERPQMTCMPVIRHPNFSDITADLPIGKFLVRTGNEKGKALKTTPLGALLEDPRAFLTAPESWAGTGSTLLAEKDTHFLVSAQACFLPIPKEGEATFNPVLFNYQSYASAPAVLAILVTREGTSVTIIDNTRDAVPGGMGCGQRLFFNSDGQKASLTGKRLSEFKEPAPTAPSTGSFGDEAKAGQAKGLNMVLLVQVPLKQKEPQRLFDSEECFDKAAAGAMPSEAMSESSNVEEAVIGHGELEGPFVEFDNLPVERDPRFPVRVTVQFYKATDNGVVSEDDMRSIKEQLDLVYKDATYVGSLVVPAGNDPTRPTDWKPTKPRL